MASSGAGRTQRRMGPAPFASLEDLSDEADNSPTEPPPVRLPGIHEDAAGASAGAPPRLAVSSALTPGTPRIDISRASSSSHHEDSRDSTPERELFQGPGGKACARLGIAFTEEGALELRSSTEELDFHEERRRDATDDEHQQHLQQQRLQRHRAHQQQRKDSQGSDMGLLSISGRTSRLSSVGSSQGSGRVSDASRLSVASGASRSPSPHKMLLETSFCGSRTCLAGEAAAVQATTSAVVGAASPELETEVLERVLLSRHHDPTEAVLAEGISIECRRKIQPAPVVSLETCAVESEKSSAQSSPLPTPGKTVVSDSGVEYTFIPLKGPLPKNALKPQRNRVPEPKGEPPKPKPKPAETNEPPQYIRIKLKPDHMYADINHCGPPPVQKPDSLDLSDGKLESRLPTRTTVPPSVRCTPSPVSRKNSFVSLFRGSASPESPSTRKRLSLTGDGSRSRSKSSDRVGPSTSTRASTSKPNHHRSVFALFKPKKSLPSDTSPTPPSLPPSNLGSANTGLSGLAFSFRREQPLEADSIIIPLHSPSEKREPFTYTDEPQLDARRSEPEAVRHPSEADTRSYTREPELVKRSPDSDKIRYSKEVDRVRHAREPDKQKHTKEAEKLEPEKLKHTKEPDKVKHTKESEVVIYTKAVHAEQATIVERRRSSTSSENVVFSTQLGADNDEVFTTKITKHDIGAVSVSEERTVKPVKAALSAAADTKPAGGADADTEPVDSSEQESEDGRAASEGRRDKVTPPADGSDGSGSEHERKGLVMQQDSFEDELPYVPTTLPQERSVAVPMVPIKQRAACEVRTCPIERPRSTTPNKPTASLEAYQQGPDDKTPVVPVPKLKISLPWDESGRRSPSRRSGSVPPPPLPPRGATAVTEWVNFEDIPERRKPPKRIQTIPSRAALTLGQPLPDENVVYSYVNPEDCKCECHETGARASAAATAAVTSPERHEDELPLLMTADRRSDSSLDSQTSAPPPPPKRMGRAAPSNANPRLTSS